MQGVFPLHASCLESGYPMLLLENGQFSNCAVANPDGFLLSLDMLLSWPFPSYSLGSWKPTDLDWSMWRCCAAPAWARLVQCSTDSWPSRKVRNHLTQRCFSCQSEQSSCLPGRTWAGLYVYFPFIPLAPGEVSCPSPLFLSPGPCSGSGCCFISSWCNLGWHRAAAYKINEYVP